jgi:hypothetical protein
VLGICQNGSVHEWFVILNKEYLLEKDYIVLYYITMKQKIGYNYTGNLMFAEELFSPVTSQIYSCKTGRIFGTFTTLRYISES